MNSRKWLYFSLAWALFGASAAGLLWLKAHQKLGPAGLSMDLPVQVLQYQSRSIPAAPEELYGLPKDTTISRRLYSAVDAGETNELLLTIVLMGTDRTSIHKPQFCLVGQGWQINSTEHVSVPIEQPHPYDLPVIKLTASKLVPLPDGRSQPMRALYVYWFVADQSLTADHWQRMWWMAKHLLLTGELQRWAYVSCFAYCAPGQEAAAFDRVRRFVATAVPAFQKATMPVRLAAGRALD